jgi:hypothetical protein
MFGRRKYFHTTENSFQVAVGNVACPYKYFSISILEIENQP